MRLRLCIILAVLCTGLKVNVMHITLQLSVSIYFDGPNTQQMLSVYAFITSSAFLDFIGMQKVNPVSMHTAVSAYLFPLLEGGRWNSPIKSMAMNSIGCGGTLKCSFWICWTFMLCIAHVLHALVSLNSLFHAFPMVHLFEWTVGPFESIVTLLVVC